MAELKKAEYWQRGESIDYLNAGDDDIPAASVVVLGGKIGIAGTDIPAGELGSLHMEGVYRIPKKASITLSAGDDVKYTSADGIDKAESGDTVVGYAVEASAASDTTALVKLVG